MKTDDDKKKKDKKPLISRFSQFIVFFCMLYGLALTTVSYIWVMLGYQPLVDLSTTIIQTIVGPCTVWLCQNMICNVFENNKLAFSTPLTAINNSTPSSPTISDFAKDDKAAIEDNASFPALDSFEFGNGSGLGDDEI